MKLSSRLQERTKKNARDPAANARDNALLVVRKDLSVKQTMVLEERVLLRASVPVASTDT